MADQIDDATRLADEHLERSLAAARQPVARGCPGECEACLDNHPRLVKMNGLMLCARCRDKREKRR